MAKEEVKKITTMDFFHVAALVSFGFRIDKITTVEGFGKKGLVSFLSDKKIPSLLDFNIELNGETISLGDFATNFRRTKSEIFKIIDGDLKNEK